MCPSISRRTSPGFVVSLITADLKVSFLQFNLRALVAKRNLPTRMPSSTRRTDELSLGLRLRRVHDLAMMVSSRTFQQDCLDLWAIFDRYQIENRYRLLRTVAAGAPRALTPHEHQSRSSIGRAPKIDHSPTRKLISLRVWVCERRPFSLVSTGLKSRLARCRDAARHLTWRLGAGLPQTCHHHTEQPPQSCHRSTGPLVESCQSPTSSNRGRLTELLVYRGVVVYKSIFSGLSMLCALGGH